MHSKIVAIVIMMVTMLAVSYAQNVAGSGGNLTIRVGEHPVDVAVNDRTNMIYVANSGSSDISVINGSSNKVIDIIDVNITKDIRSNWEGEIKTILIDKIADITINPTTNVIYVAKAYHFTLQPTGDAVLQTILAINGSTNKIVNNTDISSNSGTVKMAVDPNKNLLYFILPSPSFCIIGLGECGMSFPERIYALNGSDYTWNIYGYTGYDNVIDIDFAQKSNLIYVVRLDKPSHTSLLTYDIPIANLSESFPTILFGTEGNITSIAFDSESDKIYLIVNSLSSSSFLAEIEGTTGELIGTIDIPKSSDLALNSETDIAYVTHPNDNLVSIIDISALGVIERITVSDRPVSVEVNSRSNMVYVVGQESDSVTVINGETNAIVPEFAGLTTLFVAIGITIVIIFSIRQRMTSPYRMR